jgi:hypothetical protein
VDNHLNFVFHAETGKIIAATAYPGTPSEHVSITEIAS